MRFTNAIIHYLGLDNTITITRTYFLNTAAKMSFYTVH